MSTPYTVRAFESWVVRTRKGLRGALLFSVAGPLIYLGAMGSGLGSLVTAENPSVLDGVRYADFIAPGMLAAAAMQTAVGEATWPVLGALKWDKSYHAMLATPLRVVDVFYGHLMLIATRLVLSCVTFALAAVLLGFRSGPLGLLVVPAAAFTGIACAAPIAAWSIGRQNDNSFSILFRVIAIPLFMFSGTFFPIETLPRALEVAVQLTPLWHGVELCRGLFLGTLDAGWAVVHVTYLSVLLVTGLVLGQREYAKALST